MLAFAIRRIAMLVPTLFVIVTASFLIIRLAPGSPFADEQGLSPTVRRNLDAAYGLDQPIGTQYARYLSRLAHGDFGPSLRFRDASVGELIAQGLPVSLSLGACAIVLAVLLGVPLGLLAALRRDGWLDHGARALAAAGIALPSFVVGPLLALVFGLYLRWLPVAGWERGAPQYAVLPVVTLALPVAAYVSRLTRASFIDILRAGFIRTARAKGLGEIRIMLHHALRPALMPVVSYLGPAVAFIVTGSLVVETIFGVPGTGRYLVQGAIDRDYTLVMGMIIVYGALTLGCNLLADLLYGWLDPRVRHE